MDPFSKNYPSGCTDKEILTKIDEIQNELSGKSHLVYGEKDANIASTLTMYSSMLQLGQAEIVKRKTIKTLEISRYTLLVSAIAAIISLVTLIMSAGYSDARNQRLDMYGTNRYCDQNCR